MCLQNIKKLNKKEQTGIGYKVYKTYSNYRSMYGETLDSKNTLKVNGFYHNRIYKIGETYNKDPFNLEDRYYKTGLAHSEVIDPGFHIYDKLSSIPKDYFDGEIIVKVNFIKGTHSGSDPKALNKVIVADQITLLEIIK